jgi:SSS family transporter
MPTQPAGPFSLLDWSIVAAYLLLTTLLGARLAGRQATIRDFFLGGRKLPWWAICGSIIATEISAATIVGVPTLSYAAGGNLTYLQLALGSILARLIVAWWFVPRYYEEEIYSPYDYVGRRLGPAVKRVTTALFMLGAVLGQGARLYITAFVLSGISGTSLSASVWLIGLFSVAWTLLGGMTTVIWTDVIQFGVILVGALTVLACSISAVPGSLGQVVLLGAEAGKFALLDLSADPSLEYTLWAGLLAMPFLNLAAFGTDQVMAQRMFCCRDQRDARRAIIWSSLGLVIPVVMLGVGIALYAYFRHHPPTAHEAGLLARDKTYLLPLFIVRALPVGIRAVIVAAIFAAAISTLDGALTALAQTSLAPVLRWTGRPAPTDGGEAAGSGAVAVSKLLTILWGVALCLMALACVPIAGNYRNVIDLALGLSGYLYGPLLGIFLLAFLGTGRDDAGLVWAVPLSVLCIFGISAHHAVADGVVWGGAGVAAVLGVVSLRGGRVLVVAGAAAMIVGLHHLPLGVDEAGRAKHLAFTWTYPIGTIMALAVAWLVGRRRPSSPPAQENAR